MSRDYGGYEPSPMVFFVEGSRVCVDINKVVAFQEHDIGAEEESVHVAGVKVWADGADRPIYLTGTSFDDFAKAIRWLPTV